MGKCNRYARKKGGPRGWKANSKDGRLLAKLLQTKKITAGSGPGVVKEMFPVFNKYKADSFAAGLRRMKTKLGINVRGNTGTSIDVDRWLVLGSIDLLLQSHASSSSSR